jgi:cbb3-type cytochrome oxidase subunit 3
MSNTLQTLLGCGGSIFIVLLAIAYIITSAGRKKSECPNCTKKVAPKQAFYDDPETGQRTLGESDFAFALVASIGNILIGLAAVGFPLYLVLGALGDESCAVEGIIIRCVSYTSTMKVETTLNLLIMGIIFLAGIFGVFNGLGRFVRATKSRGQPITREFECPACKNTWTEASDQKDQQPA